MDIKGKFSTRAVHAGQKPDPATGAVMTPVYLTSTYVQESPGVHKGFEYSRTQNPTRKALEENLAALEGGEYGLCFSSGMAAISAVISALSSGDHVLSGDDLYGGTYRVFTKVFERFGILFDFVDTTNSEEVLKKITPKTKLLWLETPTNPLLNITDISEVSKIAHAKNVPVAVDNTFATPYLQEPLSLGADLVVHSSTKYIGGHSDVVGGAVITSDKSWYERLKFIQNSVGAVPGPMDSFLLLRGTKTLALRMERHCENALQIARFLLQHPKVLKVYYPGLESHKGHTLAKKQMRAFGGMISFELADGFEAAKKMASQMKIFSLAESLGGVESLIGHPATMTHAAIPREERLKRGLTDGLIRLSVGIEDAEDLISDLSQALDK